MQPARDMAIPDLAIPDDASWQAFARQLGGLAHPRRLAAAFDGLISDEAAAKLADEERFQERLSALVGGRYGLSPDDGVRAQDEAGARLAFAPPAQLDAFVTQFGAVYRARAIVRVIESSAVVALQQVLGEEAYAAAIAHRDLADPDATLPPADALAATVRDDGLRCLAAWCDGQPQAVGGRIRLRLAPGEAIDGVVPAPFDRLGPPIVANVLS